MAGESQTHIEPAENSGLIIWPGWTTAIIVLGIALRLTQYLINRSLWYDEALLALNILHRPLREIFQPLQYHQGAPIGFLLLEKLAVALAGKSELALRIVPLTAGIASLFIFRHVARLFVSAKAVLLGLLLFALCPSLVYYSSEVKQYSSDVAVTLVLLWMLFRLADSSLPSRVLLIGGGVGAAAVWFSHPASFVLAGAGTVLIVAAMWQGDWRRIRRLAPVLAVWAASFAIYYFVSLRHLASDQSLLDYWNGAFPPHPFWSTDTFSFLIDNFYAAFSAPAGLLPILGATLFLLGCAQLIRKGPLAFLLLTASIAVMLLASYLGKYPLEARLLLFVTPILLLAVAEGAVRCCDFSRWFSAVLGVVVIAALLAPPISTSFKNLIHPPRLGDLKPTLRYVLTHQQPGDDWYVYNGSKCQLAYYAELYKLTPRHIRFGATCGGDAACYATDLVPLNGGRTWILLSHILIDDGVDEGNVLVGQIDKRGTVLDVYRTRGGRAYLYDLTKASQGDPSRAQTLNQSRAPAWDDDCISTTAATSSSPHSD